MIDGQTPHRAERFRPRHVIGTLVAVMLVLVTGWAAFELTLAGAIAGASQQAERRLVLFDRTLEAMIERFHYLPATIAQADESQEVLERADGISRSLRKHTNLFGRECNSRKGHA